MTFLSLLLFLSYNSAASIDHSCSPNCVIIFNGINLTVRTLEKLSNQNEARLSYINLLNTKEDRQDMLLKQYYFKCQCSRCVDTSKNNLVRPKFI